MQFLLPIAIGATALVAIKTFAKTAKFAKKRNNRKNNG